MKVTQPSNKNLQKTKENSVWALEPLGAILEKCRKD